MLMLNGGMIVEAVVRILHLDGRIEDAVLTAKDLEDVKPAPKKRGRKKKNPAPVADAPAPVVAEAAPAAPKKKRGRPRKNPLPAPAPVVAQTPVLMTGPGETAPKRNGYYHKSQYDRRPVSDKEAIFLPGDYVVYTPKDSDEPDVYLRVAKEGNRSRLYKIAQLKDKDGNFIGYARNKDGIIVAYGKLDKEATAESGRALYGFTVQTERVEPFDLVADQAEYLAEQAEKGINF